MTNLLELRAVDEAGHLRVVVEAPKGSRAKLKYQPALGAFELQRFILDPYPHDWGFVPGTRAPDGDPLDALVIHERSTWPGVVIPSIAIGVLQISEQPNGSVDVRRNDRLIAVPAAAPDLRSLSELNAQARTALERFFVTTGELAKKRVTVQGWGDASEAERALEAARAEFAKRT